MSLPGSETSIWYGSEMGVSLSEVPLIQAAVRNLGNLSMRVISDPDEARNTALSLAKAHYKKIFPDTDKKTIEELANFRADLVEQNMYPLPKNSNDPLRLVEIISTNGSPVLPHAIYEEIKHRVRPGLGGGVISVDEVLYSALNPVDPQTLFD